MRSRTWTLLTGDGELRNLANEHKVEIHGVLWVFDLLFDLRIMDGKALVDALTAISEHPRCRLPKADLHARLTVFGKVRR
jgi:hypothetical protein